MKSFLSLFLAILAAAGVIGLVRSCNEDQARQARNHREIDELLRQTAPGRAQAAEKDRQAAEWEARKAAANAAVAAGER